jgi:PAS domain-containing protein
MQEPSRTKQELIEENTLFKQRIQELEKSEAQLKLTNEVMEKSSEIFRKAFHTNQDSININRLADGMYVSINEGFVRMTGYTEEDVIGTAIRREDGG